jgi:ABC-2 type transport system permease protein
MPLSGGKAGGFYSRYFVFLQKEITENLRTKKLLVLGCVFLFFAFTSPLLARYIGEFFEFLMPAAEAELFMAMLPPPSWVDSYAQFYGNVTQVGTIVVILMYMGLVLREKTNGTADLVFCKGLSPASFILAKFTVAAMAALLCLLAAIFINYGYTVMLFNEGGHIGHVLAGAGAYAVFVLMMLAWVILSSTLAKSTGMAALFGFLGFMGLIPLSILPRIGRFSPGNLMTNNLTITLGHYPDELAANIGLALGLTAVFLWLAIRKLKKQEW